MSSKNTNTSVVKFYNGEAWSFTSDDSEGIGSVTFGKRFVMGGLSKNYNSSSLSSSAANGNSSNKGGSKNDNKVNKAVIKITGHNYSAGKLKAHIDYISRNGSIEMEDHEGETHKDEINKSYSEWVVDHAERENDSEKISPRIASSIVFSAPPGSSPDKLLDSVREFSSKAYSGHRYLMVLHTEETETNTGKITKHPHVHLVVERRSPNNEKALETNLPNIMAWRKEFSEIAKSRGLELSYHRDEISKQPVSATNRYVYAMLKKGEVPEEFKVKYEIAKNRLKENRVYQSSGEKKLINNAVEIFTSREKEISDINVLIKESNNPIRNQKYKKEKKYLEYINSSQRMPVSTSQLLLKYAIHERKSKTNKDYKFNTAVPTVKHYMYGLKIANSHGIDLPPTANLDTKMLSGFIKEYSNKSTPKFNQYIKDIAADRGLEIKESTFNNQKSARMWLKYNMSHATLKALNQAYKLSDQFNVDIPKKLDNKSISAFIQTYASKPSQKMVDYAATISKRSGVILDKDQLTDKTMLSKWISKNESIQRTKNPLLKELSAYNVKPENLEPIKENKAQEIKDEHIIKVVKSGVNFPKDRINDNEYKLNFLRSHVEFKDSEQWTRLNDKMKSQEKTVSKTERFNNDLDRD